ncbi:hypothetical protein pb186bvf_000771 [Paramecium bursaria]
MDQEIRPKRASILKRQPTIEKHEQHVHIDSDVHIIVKEKEDFQMQKAEDIHVPKHATNLTEKQLIKLALKQPEIWDDEDKQ